MDASTLNSHRPELSGVPSSIQGHCVSSLGGEDVVFHSILSLSNIRSVTSFFFFLNIYAGSAYRNVGVWHAYSADRSEEGIKAPGPGVRGGCELP